MAGMLPTGRALALRTQKYDSYYGQGNATRQHRDATAPKSRKDLGFGDLCLFIRNDEFPRIIGIVLNGHEWPGYFVRPAIAALVFRLNAHPVVGLKCVHPVVGNADFVGKLYGSALVVDELCLRGNAASLYQPSLVAIDTRFIDALGDEVFSEGCEHMLRVSLCGCVQKS